MMVKCGREEFNLNNEDIIFDNGACFQITTRQERYKACPVISKAKAKQLLKEGEIILIKENLAYTLENGTEYWHRYYKIKDEV